jgi:dienelactone hydrolase
VSFVLAMLAVAVTGSAAAATVRAGWPTLGVYQLADGSLASIFVNQGYLRALDYGSGEYRALQEQSRGLWVGGPGATVFSPVRVRVRVEGARRIAVDGQTGTLIPLVERPVGFADRGVHFAARLLLPRRPGPFPGVVIVPGSERANRWTYDLWAYFYAAHGVAVLTYDKRGVRGSGGSYDSSASTANLRLLASDALAALNTLRRQPQIDTTRLGLAGASQAGWVIAIAAAHSSAVKFAALESAPAMSVGRQLAYEFITTRGRLDPPPTDAQIQTALSGKPDSGYNPSSDIASLRIPVLWQLGALDKRMYTPETVADLEQIEASGSHDFTIHVYPGGAHSLRLTANGLISEERSSPGFCPGVFPDLAAWLQSSVLAR